MGKRWTVMLLAVAALAAVPSARADEQVWHPTLEKGVEAAAQSGKPLLVVTAWKPGV